MARLVWLMASPSLLQLSSLLLSLLVMTRSSKSSSRSWKLKAQPLSLLWRVMARLKRSMLILWLSVTSFISSLERQSPPIALFSNRRISSSMRLLWQVSPTLRENTNTMPKARWTPSAAHSSSRAPLSKMGRAKLLFALLVSIPKSANLSNFWMETKTTHLCNRNLKRSLLKSVFLVLLLQSWRSWRSWSAGSLLLRSLVIKYLRWQALTVS